MPNPIYRIRVAVPIHLYDCFDYQVSAQQYEQAQVGARVAVSFGRQHLVAIIVEKIPPETALNNNFKLKSITELIDDFALFSEKHLRLLTWAAQYYHFPLGEVLHSALATLLRQGKPYNLLARQWDVLNFDADHLIKRSSKQQQAYKLLKLHPHATNESILLASGIEASTLKALEKKGIIACHLAEQDFRPQKMTLAQIPLKANPDQQHAIDSIVKTLKKYQGFLLDGLTGSGKTEVYLQVMEKVLQKGKQVLVLVPEIGLTPQTVSRFQSRFHCHIAVLHSGLNDSKRLQAWQAAQTGKASIILGTRSAVLTPMPNLGLIILDEEHDLSFKQQDSFRYHARDVALYRAYLEGCPIILGSATPSIESYALVEKGKLQHLELNQRAGAAIMPKMHVIDLVVAKKKHGLSLQLIEEIQKRLDKKEQVLIFLNRRGYAPVLICESCAWQAKCPHCAANATLHREPYEYLHCHHCNTIQTKPQHCPNCQQPTLKSLGLGTAQVEHHLQELFPEIDVIRVDRDSTTKVGSWQKIYDRIQSSQPIILLGTQMLAKGHHFPYVTLVAILDIDAGLMSVDFRAPERTAQLIVQVSGRAGRGHLKGDVYLQTLKPDHPLIQTLLHDDYRQFAKQSLKERQSAGFPPYRYSALIRCESPNQDENQKFLHQHAVLLSNEMKDLVDIWGPIPAPLERKAGRYQAHLLIFSQDRAQLHFYLNSWWQNILQQKPTAMKLSLDIDPQELS